MDYAEKVDGGRQRRFVRGVIGRFVGFCAMEYKRLGASGLQVSPICLGAMEFGDGADARTVGRIVCMAREAGVNFIDTAVTNNGSIAETVSLEQDIIIYMTLYISIYIRVSSEAL